MAAPDFYFAINATFRHLHDAYGMEALIDYWHCLGREYYRRRTARWKAGNEQTLASDWRDYFAAEPQAVVTVAVAGQAVELDIQVCPAIKHLRDHGRDIVPYFCEHCDHICAAMAEEAGYTFQRTGGGGACQQRFVRQRREEGGRLMLGCQDFCGYYEWTFHYLRRRWGVASRSIDIWAEAIAGESQQHYTQSASQGGLRGLYAAVDQDRRGRGLRLDLTLDEAKNVLRWDMRQCPSKGFLIANDLHADEDYCDHCLGWMIPLLAKLGVEVAEHEHNHCGQCWGTMRARPPVGILELEIDIRKSAWNHGFLHRWEHGRPEPLLPSVSTRPTPATC